MIEKGLDSYYLKWIAIICMTIDHVAWAFVNTGSPHGAFLHTIGKFTGPLMFYFLVEGYHHTHNLKNYMKRMFIFSIISYFPFSIAANYGHGLGLNLSIFSTLLVGLVALYSNDKIKNIFLKWIVFVALTLITFCMDWNYFGVMIILAFGLFYGNRKKQLIAYLVVAYLMAGYMYYLTNHNIYWTLPYVISPVFVVLLLLLYNGKRRGGRFSKWFFYIYYPAHFAAIGIVYLFVNGFKW